MFKLFKYLKKYWWAAVLAPLFMLGEVYLDMVITEQMQVIIDEGISCSNLEVVKAEGLLMLGMVLLGVICGFMSGVFGNIASCCYANDLRQDLYAKIMKLSYNQTDKFSTSSLITRVTNDVTQMQTFIAQVTRMLIRQVSMFVLGIIFTVRIDARFGIILLVILPLILLFMVWMGRKTSTTFATMQVKIDNINKVVHENVSGARVVKAFSKEDYEDERFKKANVSYADSQWYVNKLFAIMSPAFMLIIYAVQVVMYSIGGSSILEAFNNGTYPDITIGKVTQATTYVVMICFAMIMFSMVFINITRAIASAKRINAVLDCPLEIENGNVKLEDINEVGTVEFKNVSFRYPEASEDILTNINVKINKGETVAIVGATGCGKTTLISLITRFYDVTGGEVLVDGVNVKDYNQYELRNKISVALQKAELFAGSIKDNILWGDSNASDDDVKLAAEISQAKEAIDAKEHGFDEYVEEKGTSLSGGQKQRISIARAIVKKPEILIFDDATSALDLVTEAKLYKAMKQYINDTTRIVVAQRVATAKNADKIIVMDQGTIVAFDTHENLLKNCPIYQDIYDSQLKREGAF